MDYIITIVFLAFWSFMWYKIGYFEAQMKELNSSFKQLNKELEKNCTELEKACAKNEETINRY